MILSISTILARHLTRVPELQNERFWLSKTKFLGPDWYGLGTARFLLDGTLTTLLSDFPAEVGELKKTKTQVFKNCFGYFHFFASSH